MTNMPSQTSTFADIVQDVANKCWSTTECALDNGQLAYVESVGVALYNLCFGQAADAKLSIEGATLSFQHEGGVRQECKLQSLVNPKKIGECRSFVFALIQEIETNPDVVLEVSYLAQEG